MSEMTNIIAIKTDTGEWALDVLGVPFDSVDSDGEYFTERTQTYADRYTDPMILYYHSYDETGRPQGDPEIIGKATNIEKRAGGWWYRVTLDKSKAYAKRIWESAKNGMAAASSGSIAHVARIFEDGKLVPYAKGIGGEIGVWPVVELSLIDIGEGRRPANRYAVALPVAKMRYERAGLSLPDDIDGESDDGSEGDGVGAASAAAQKSEPGAAEDEPNNQPEVSSPGDNIMDEQEVQRIVAESVAAALKAEKDAADAAAELEAEIEAREKAAAKAATDALIESQKAEKDKAAKKAAEDRRPASVESGGGAHVTQFDNIAKFDDLEAADIAVLYGVTNAAKMANKGVGPSEDLRRALAIRIAEDPDKDREFVASKRAMKSAGLPIKANELNQSTLSSYGDEWVGVTYSTQLWNKIRMATDIVGMLPTVTVPQGSESVIIPLESTAPTFYKVAQASAQAANPGSITPTQVTSKQGTTSQTLTVSKLGAAVNYTGELEEDSLIPWAAELRRSLTAEAAEVLEHIAIDGDTDTSATTNINDIGGTPAGTEAFLIANGFRKLALVTNTANSRDGGALAVEDFLETAKLMGLGGRNAFDRTKVGLIADMATYWKSLTLTEMKNRDYGVNPTVAGQSVLTPWGYRLWGSANMHRANQNATYGLKANSAGKVDLDTASNNTLGAVLGVRWDQWRFGYKRQMTFEIERDALADATTIVVMMRVGLIYRDTDAAAISYNITV